MGNNDQTRPRTLCSHVLRDLLTIALSAGLASAAGADHPANPDEPSVQTAFAASKVAERLEMLPEPSGSHAVSTRRFHWTDRDREEGASQTAGDFRELYVQLYYPTPVSPQPKARSRYFRDLQAYQEIFTAEVFERLLRTGVHTTADGPVARSQRGFPVLLFVHGWQAQSDAYATLMADLASRGHVVAAIDQPYQGRIALADGRVTQPSEDHFADPMAMVKFYGADQAFVLTKLAELNAADGDFAGHLDLARVIAMGHSNGAVSALSAALHDERFKGAIAIDSWDPVFEQVFQLKVPLLVLRTGQEAAPRDAYLKGSATALDISVAGTHHLSASDWPWHHATSDEERRAAATHLRLISDLIAAFVQIHAGSGDRSALDALAADERITLRDSRQKPAAP